MDSMFFDDLEAARDSLNDALFLMEGNDPRRANLYQVLSGLDGVLAKISEGVR